MFTAETALSNAGLTALQAQADTSPKALNAYLDTLLELKDRELPAGSLAICHMPGTAAPDIDSQDRDRLLAILDSDIVIDRVVASIRLLQIPAILLPRIERNLAALRRAQRVLSESLVAFPVLMHNRIFIRGMHFHGWERGPIATVIAHTPRAEFPRTAHGIPLDKLTAFAKHPCVASGLLGKAPLSTVDKPAKARYQGMTLLQSVIAPLREAAKATSRPMTAKLPGYFASLLELESLQAAGRKASEKPLTHVPDNCKDWWWASLAESYLVHVGAIETGGRNRDLPGLEAVFNASSHTLDERFLNAVEARLYKVSALEPDTLAPALASLANSLLQIKPTGLPSATNLALTKGERPAASMEDAIRWLTVALLDSSPARADRIDAQFKSPAFRTPDKFILAVAALDKVDPVGYESGATLSIVRGVVEGLTHTDSEMVLSALTAYSMDKVLDAAARLRALMGAASSDLATEPGTARQPRRLGV